LPQIARAHTPTLIYILDKYMSNYCSAAPVATVALYAGGTSILRGYRHGKPSTTVDTDWVFGIGSNTKVFTSTLLAHQSVGSKPSMKLTDSVVDFLPAVVKQKGNAIKQVRLVDLATQTSSFPRAVAVEDGNQPFTDRPVTSEQVRWWINWKNDGPPSANDACAGQSPGKCWLYSDWGFITLANAVTRSNSIPSMVYSKQLLDVVTRPLGMRNTGRMIKLSVPGYNNKGHVVKHQPTDLRSSANDMLNWITACLGDFPGIDRQLREAIALTIQPQWTGTIGSGVSSMGLGWQLPTPKPNHPQIVWKNGVGSGYYSFMGLIPSHSVGVAILTNSEAANPTGGGLALLPRLSLIY
jgi:CubicO group peptidase (beta-lactamase class C family)